MLQISDRRDEIYNYFHQNSQCQNFFIYGAHEDRYAAYYTSMNLLQDTTESLIAHRERGFSSDPLIAYIEFWGVMQAIIIQQDSIKELYEAITGISLKTKELLHWQELRELRNICAGHPAKKDRPKNSPISRTFMGRNCGNYTAITYEQWEGACGYPSHPTVPLGAMIDAYAIEAETKLTEILDSMKQQWP
jgi:hypothetical protein